MKEVYPIPRVEDALEFLANVQYLAVFDALQGYHQVEVAEEDIEKTAFTTREGHWEFVRMPFSLLQHTSNVPATDGSTDGRIELAHLHGLHRRSDHPWTGLGMDSFKDWRWCYRDSLKQASR